jgi:ATP-binding cassette, subfamily B, bacterial
MITLGTVYLIVTYTNLLRRPIRELTQQVENLQNIGAATERLRELRAIQAKNHRRPRRENFRPARWRWL